MVAPPALFRPSFATTWIPGENSATAPTRIELGADSSVTMAAFHTPNCDTRRLRSIHAVTMAAREIAIIPKYSSVRAVIVSGSPTDGGLTGYFRLGTT